MDVTCPRCAETWSTDHLLPWLECSECGQLLRPWPDGTVVHDSPTLRRLPPGSPPPYPTAPPECRARSYQPVLVVVPADNGDVPDELRQPGPRGWLPLVLGGRGCPACQGQPRPSADPPTPADLDAATDLGQAAHTDGCDDRLP